MQSTAPSRGPVACRSLPVLRRNDRQRTPNEDVKVLQRYLNYYGFPLTVDGYFGPKTEDAVKGFQERVNDHDLSFLVDGIVGPRTWGALGACVGA
ncbi:MAG: peptidoglycan-binding domain-containing protein [Thainema sp.]